MRIILRPPISDVLFDEIAAAIRLDAVILTAIHPRLLLLLSDHTFRRRIREIIAAEKLIVHGDDGQALLTRQMRRDGSVIDAAW